MRCVELLFDFIIVLISSKLETVKHNFLVSLPFKFAIRSKWLKNSLKPTIIHFFDSQFARRLANHVTLVGNIT